MSPEGLASFAFAFEAVRRNESFGTRTLQGVVERLSVADFACLRKAVDAGGHGGPYMHTSLSAPNTPVFRALQRFERYGNPNVTLDLARSGFTAGEVMASTVRGMCEDEFEALTAAVATR